LVKEFNEHKGKVLCLCNYVIGAENYVVSGSFDTQIIAYNTVNYTHQLLENNHNDTVRSICQLNAQLWTASRDKRICVWNFMAS